jgi:hypothetical protein
MRHSPHSVRPKPFNLSTDAYSLLDTELTSQPEAQFYLVGNSSAIANMSIGQVLLNPIKVNVSTSLRGLKGLNGLTTIENVDVVGGTTSAIQLDIAGGFVFASLME